MNFKEKLYVICDKVIKMLVDKRHDYGLSFDELWEKVGPITASVRLWDKVNRLIHLTSTKSEAKFESIEDTFLDIIGYCLLALNMMKKNDDSDVDDCYIATTESTATFHDV